MGLEPVTQPQSLFLTRIQSQQTLGSDAFKILNTSYTGNHDATVSLSRITMISLFVK